MTGQGPADRVRGRIGADPRLLTWAHIAETDSLLRAYSSFGSRPLDKAGRDGYVADMAAPRPALAA